MTERIPYVVRFFYFIVICLLLFSLYLDMRNPKPENLQFIIKVADKQEAYKEIILDYYDQQALRKVLLIGERNNENQTNSK